MGNSHSKSTALGLTKLLAKALELLRTGYNSAHRADVLSESRKVPNQPDADLKIMLAEESESPPDDTENC